jgi:hypothetical protein
VVAVSATVIVVLAGVALVRLGRTPVVSACQVQSASGPTYSLGPVQAQNASIIAAVAAQKALPDHAVSIALAAALQESKLNNLDYGDLDSVGLFQQRPSQGWGTRVQILDPAYAAAAFYDRLVTVPGWETMAVGDVAQAVQLSAVPGAYAPWESEARALARALTGEVPAGLSCQLAGWAGSPPAPGSLAAAAQAEFGSPELGIQLGAKQGWQVACWAVAHAYNYHLRAVAYGGRRWDPSSGRWSADPSAGPVVSATS